METECTVDGASLGRFAYLNEGIYRAAAYSKRSASPADRRAIVLLTDAGADIPLGKAHSEKEAFRELFEAGSSVWGLVARSRHSEVAEAMYLVNPVFVFLSRLWPRGSAKAYVERTGGDAIEAKGRHGDELAEMFNRLRLCYTLGYVSGNPKLNGEFRRIKVRLKAEVEKREGKSMAIVAKQGYFAVRN